MSNATMAMAYQMDSYPYMSMTIPALQTRSCFCVGGPNCCIKVAEREREARIREEAVRAYQRTVERHPGDFVPE